MKKKVLYVERGIDEYGLYEGTQDAMKDLNVELSITLDPKDIEDCDGVIFPGGLPDVDPELYGEENQGSMNLDRTLDDEADGNDRRCGKSKEADPGDLQRNAVG